MDRQRYRKASIRRFTHLVENHRAAVALHFSHYNFVRRHQTIRCSLAMAAGVSRHLGSMEELVERSTT